MTGKLEREHEQQAPGGAPAKINKLTGRVTAVSLKARGESVVTLDNGQVWEEAESSWHQPLKVGDTVTISAGMLGSYWLDAERLPRLRVRRIK